MEDKKKIKGAVVEADEKGVNISSGQVVEIPNELGKEKGNQDRE